MEEEEEGAREDERCRDEEEARLEAPSPREEEARLTDEERIYTGKYISCRGGKAKTVLASFSKF